MKQTHTRRHKPVPRLPNYSCSTCYYGLMAQRRCGKYDSPLPIHGCGDQLCWKSRIGGDPHN